MAISKCIDQAPSPLSRSGSSFDDKLRGLRVAAEAETVQVARKLIDSLETARQVPKLQMYIPQTLGSMRGHPRHLAFPVCPLHWDSPFRKIPEPEPHPSLPCSDLDLSELKIVRRGLTANGCYPPYGGAYPPVYPPCYPTM